MIIKIHNHCQFEPNNSLSFQGFCKWCGKEQSEHSTTMSNNKQSVKLYTEEQVREAFIEGHEKGWLRRAYAHTGRAVQDADEFLNENELAAIELPTDMEIEKASRGRTANRPAFNTGAKWLRDKLTNTKEK
jgi:hypothetical protein